MSKSVICTTYFSQKIHPNDPNDRHVTGRQSDGRVLQNSIQYIEPWYNSIKNLSLNGIVFYDNLDDDFINKYKTDHITFVKVNPSEYSNNDWRFFCYRDFFLDHTEYDSIFLTDGSDVTVIKDPHQIIDEYKNAIDFFICKDSILLSDFPYMQVHQQAKWENTYWFHKKQTILPLLNMGVIGGNRENMLEFLETFCHIRIRLGQPDFNSDMWIGQYLFRYSLSHKNLLVGEPFTSQFKKYQLDRKDVYFVHK